MKAINLNGGKGANGQDGGDAECGAKGEDGKAYDMSTVFEFVHNANLNDLKTPFPIIDSTKELSKKSSWWQSGLTIFSTSQEKNVTKEKMTESKSEIICSMQ